jgi:cobalt/nickel transport system permease protein
VTAGRRVRKVVKQRYVPLVAIGAAYCFLVMMFNVPVPDGTTAHAVGGVLVACLLGPWAAVIAVSTALLIQALFFGDGGVLAFGANAFNMAIVMPLVGYAVYRALSWRVPIESPRRAFAAGAGAYIGLNAAALLAAIEFGLQPVLFHRADGTPLYAPFHLAQTIPAMLAAHLTVAGGVEFALTAGVFAYIQRANVPLLRLNHHSDETVDSGNTGTLRTPWRGALVALAVMALLTPLGLLAPGGAFGEASPANLDLHRYHLAAVPLGLARYAGVWHAALFHGYDFAGDAHPVVGYLVSAAVGLFALAAVAFAALALSTALRRRARAEAVRA